MSNEQSEPASESPKDRGLDELVREHGIEIELRRISDWPWPTPRGQGWRCRLRYQERSMSLPIYAMVGNPLPTATSVVEVLLYNYFTTMSTGSFEEWCSVFGHAPESKNARANYETTRHLGADLAELLGPELETFARTAGLAD